MDRAGRPAYACGVAWGDTSAHDESGVSDVIEAGTGAPGSHRLGPDWRPSRGAILLATVTLLAGLTAGYAAGNGTNGSATHRASGPAPRPSATSAAAARPVPISATQTINPLADVGPPVEQLSESCSVRTGSQLQLGVEVTNHSGAVATLTGLRIVFPGDAGALRELTWQWAPCGAIDYGVYQPVILLAPGSDAWLSATFKVLVRCPAAYPVQFSVSYLSLGVPATTILQGFPDLGTVPDMDCPSRQSR